VETSEKNKSNIVSLDWKRREVREKETRYSQYRDNSVEGRIAALEDELDRIIGVLVDTADLAESNRDHLLQLLRKLKEHKYL
jgi:mRNA-degrading endonuclease YafQ of YafQ-DinJ toxin-antitoxin module